MTAMDPRTNRRGADVDQPCRVVDAYDCVVVLRPDAIYPAQLYAVAVLAARFASCFAPGLDVVVGGKDVTGVEEIGWTEPPDRADVAASDPAADRCLSHAEQVGHIARRDLFPVAQVLDGIVVFVEGRPLHRDGARTWTTLEPMSERAARCKKWQRSS